MSQDRVKIEDRVPVETNFIRSIDQELDCIFVVHDHLSFPSIAPLGLFAEFDKALGVEK